MLELIEVAVTDGDGNEHIAKVAQCSSCHHNQFHVFQRAEQNHYHIQCTQCGVVFCHEWKCPVEGESVN